MDKSSIFIRSDKNFFRTILAKYRMGKKGRFRFPVMILLRNASYSLPQKIDLNILFQFHFHNQSAVSSLSAMGARNIKEFMKYVLIRISSSNMAFRESVQKEAQFSSSEFGYKSPAILFRSDSYKNNLFGCTSHPKPVYGITHDGKADRFLSHVNYIQIINPQKTSSLITTSEFGYKSPAILFRSDSYKNNIFGCTPHPKSIYGIIHDGKADRFLSHVNYIQIINPRKYEARSDIIEDITYPSSQKTSSWIPSSEFGYKSPSILFRSDSYKNNIFGYTPHPKPVYGITHDGKADPFLSHVNYMQIINPQKTSSWIPSSEFGYKSPSILFRNDSYKNNLFGYTSHPKSVYNLSYEEKADRLLSHINHIQVNNSLMNRAGSDRKEDTGKGSQKINTPIINSVNASQNKGTYQYFLMHRSPVNITQTKMMLNPISQRIVRNIFMNIGNRPSKYAEHIQNLHLQVRENMNPSFGKKGTSFMMKNENYVFNKTRKVEQEVDDLKKMVIETKKTLAEKSISYPSKNSGKTNIDINRIADQVYQNIERRIRIERERKGI